MSGSGTSGVHAFDAVHVAEILKLASRFGEPIVRGIWEVFQRHRPDLVPAQLPEASGAAIEAETDRIIREKFAQASPSPTPPPPKPSDR